MHIDGPMPPHFVPASGGHPGCAALQDAARQLEASFLEEMLRHAGLGELGGSFPAGQEKRNSAHSFGMNR